MSTLQKPCLVVWCKSSVYKKKYCYKHFSLKKCSNLGCNNISRKKNKCIKHHKYFYDNTFQKK